jgi:drug/metabolite transporter (DMT)-like permease
MSPVSAHSTHIHDLRRAVTLKLLSVFVFCLMAVCIKLLEHTYPTSQIVFCRSFFAIFPLLPLIWLAGQKSLMTKKPLAHLIRGAIGLAAMVATFYSLPRLPLATFTTIGFTMPLFVVLLAAVYLKEKMSAARLLALLVGFAGVLLVLRPESGFIGYAALIALLSAFLIAVVTVVIRQLTATENSLTIVVWFTLLSTAASGLWMAFEYVTPSWQDGWLLVGSGILGGLGQVLLTQSYRYGQVSILTAFEYTALIWAGLFGYLFWQEIPDKLTFAGAAIIILSGLYVLTHATRAQKRAALSSAASKPC